MTDYIGKYVKKFESGTLGSLSLSSCGNDWGLSCGSYQLTLRWGNCINFLKKYFPTESKVLFFDISKKDFASKTWPGNSYCSSPDAVKSVWQKCYNKVGADKFFEYEHAWIEANYYVPIKNKVKSYLNLDTTDRAFQECFWSWAVHEGSGGAFTSFKKVLSDNGITSLDYVDKEKFFDLIYDNRFERAGTNRYKKGLTNGSSEREILRPLLKKGTFSGKNEPVAKPTQITESKGNITYKVQVGAYSKKSNVELQLVKLKQKGFSGSIIQVGNLNKIIAGSYTDMNAAKSLQTLLKNNGFDSTIVEDKGDQKVNIDTKKFIPRTTAPSTTDKYWIHTSKGGLNDCILISGNSCIPNCFRGDTEFVTKDGIKSLRDMVGKDVIVRSKDGKWHMAKVEYFGRQKLYKVVLTNGSVYHATGNHRWIVKSQSGKTEYIKTTLELKTRDLIPLNEMDFNIIPDINGIRHGFIFGDGTLRYHDTTSSTLLCGEKIKYMEEYFSENKHYYHKNGVVEVINYPPYFKSKVLLSETPEYLLGFLIGYLASDGCVDYSGCTTISSAHRDNLELVRDICAILGIKTRKIATEFRKGFRTYETPLYRICLRQSDLRAEWFLNPKHRKRIEAAKLKGKNINRTCVKSVTEEHYEDDVYCVVEPETHSFTLVGGEYTMNCVGFAWGRFYEITGTRPRLSRANAENWYGYTQDGYKRSKTPALGAVICWAKGKVGVGSDGAGHVAIVEEIKPNGDIVTSNSGYKSKRFWMQTFTKASGYAMKGYTFQGFILPPDAEAFVVESVKINPIKGTLKVILRNDTLNVRSAPEMGSNVVGSFSYGKTAAVTGISADNQWYQLSDGTYVSTNTKYVQFTKTPEKTTFQVRVKAGSTEIKKEAFASSPTVGTISQNGVFTITEEKNGYGKLKSGAGWISLNSSLVTRLS